MHGIVRLSDELLFVAKNRGRPPEPHVRFGGSGLFQASKDPGAQKSVAKLLVERSTTSLATLI